MTKFLNKKEQVYDLHLTSYGRYLLSIGTFKPTYYTFMDDNILYDGAYAGLTESQNSIQDRIKQQPHMESTTLFTDVGTFTEHNPGGALNRFEHIFSKESTIPRRDVNKANAIIGDMRLEDNTSATPAWKIVSLQGVISSSQYADFWNDISIPQVNIELNYHLQIQDSEYLYDPNTSVDILGQTPPFIDEKIIKLIPDDLMIYVEESNTEVLSENYEIEIFKVETTPEPAGIAIGTITYDSDALSAGDTITISDKSTSVTFTFVPSAAASNQIRLSLDPFAQKLNILGALANSSLEGLFFIGLEGSVVEIRAKKQGREYNNAIVASTTNPDALIVQGMTGGYKAQDSLLRKYFQQFEPQIQDGYMMSPTPNQVERVGAPGQIMGSYSTSSVEYYFDILFDSHVNQAKACTAAEAFNKESYYIDFDFECGGTSQNNVFYDIYGKATEPEICQ